MNNLQQLTLNLNEYFHGGVTVEECPSQSHWSRTITNIIMKWWPSKGWKDPISVAFEVRYFNCLPPDEMGRFSQAVRDKLEGMLLGWKRDSWMWHRRRSDLT